MEIGGERDGKIERECIRGQTSNKNKHLKLNDREEL